MSKLVSITHPFEIEVNDNLYKNVKENPIELAKILDNFFSYYLACQPKDASFPCVDIKSIDFSSDIDVIIKVPGISTTFKTDLTLLVEVPEFKIEEIELIQRSQGEQSFAGYYIAECLRYIRDKYIYLYAYYG